MYNIRWDPSAPHSAHCTQISADSLLYAYHTAVCIVLDRIGNVAVYIRPRNYTPTVVVVIEPVLPL